VQYPANNKDGDVLITHFDHSALENTLLKLDLLGHKTLTMLRKLCEATGVDTKSISLDDEATLDLLKNADTQGVPEFESPLVRSIIKDAMPQTFEDCAKIIGLSRSTNWTPISYELIKLGTATLREVIAFREDVMVFLMSKGVSREVSYEIMERVGRGDRLTKAHEDAMVEAGAPEWYIAACNRINYLFPKAHAISYSLTAFRIAWFKAHYPEEFYRVYFDVRNDFPEVDFMVLDITETKSRLAEIESKSNEEVTFRGKDMRTLLEMRLKMLECGF
jgi:DNA polymerase-3 subunit alpha (Gram-positive type)